MEEEKEYTPQEIEQLKKDQMTYMESQLPFLQKKKEYDTLVTELEELEMRRVYAMVKTANLKAPAPEEERKLKK